MIPNNNPVSRRLELSLFLFVLLLVFSLSLYAVVADELLMWRSIAISLGISFSTFLFYPTIRGIRMGDIIMVPIWKEIETPFMEESYMDSVPAMAMEPGRRNQVIEVQLGDGTRGLVKILHYGFISFPEGRLIEIEKPLREIQAI
ncbi:MAG: hypothetical protein B6U86_03650 [Candidatus Altiarchaeales archaeon ex4484_43]|nr:MAG: hypothetical protein B6U86_03650 [Candidatus Altiarchaeales archaeon ex4484_43]RLI89513.1 MAG: hypothetical protein DRO62_01435 [Candidatus Altiarchaeales archaeon]